MIHFRIYRDCDSWRVRKVVVEALYGEFNELKDRRRMFAGPFFKWRLRLKMKRMTKLVEKMLIAEEDGPE